MTIGLVYVCDLKEKKKESKSNSSEKGQQNRDFVSKCLKHIILRSCNKNDDKVMKSIRKLFCCRKTDE